MRIGFDLDGVMYPFYQVVRHYLQAYRGINRELPDATTWAFWRDQWGLSLEQWDGYFAEGVDEEVIFAQGEPLFDASEVTHDLKNDGHTVHIITYRVHGDKPLYNTFKWLKHHNIHFDSLTVSKDKSIVNVDFMIDDNLDFYNNAIDNGVNCYLLNQPWNEQDQNVDRRVFSVYEYVNIIKSNARGMVSKYQY